MLAYNNQGFSQEITILHSNDMHSHLNGDAPSFEYSPLTPGNDKTTGGFSRIASIIKNTKASTNHPVLTVDAGDFSMGTFFHVLEENTGFQLKLMHQMGYDYVAIGNHEFDFGPESLGTSIVASSGSAKIPQLLLSNAKFNKAPEDNQLEDLFKQGVISKYAIENIQGIRVGLFALMGEDAENVAPNASPVRFKNQIRTAKQISRFLKRKKQCDLVICLSHGGVYPSDEKTCQGEDIDLAKNVRHLDVVIGGHTHSELKEPYIINGKPIVQAASFGKRIGKLTLKRESGFWAVKDYTLITVDDAIRGDADIQKMIDTQKKLLAESLPDSIRKNLNQPVVHFPYALTFKEYGDPTSSNLGPLIADAIHYYCNKTPEGADISMVAAGMIRTQYKAGDYSIEDIFRCVSLGKGNDNLPGFALSRVYVSGKELKGIMEVLRMAHKSSNANYIYFSGITAQVDMSKGFLKKIQDISIHDREGNVHQVSFSKNDTTLYSIVADSYMLKFIGLLKDMTFGIVNVKPKHANGLLVENMFDCVIDMDPEREGIQEGKQWLALLSLFDSMPQHTTSNVPVLSSAYRNSHSIYLESDQ